MRLIPTKYERMKRTVPNPRSYVSGSGVEIERSNKERAKVTIYNLTNKMSGLKVKSGGTKGAPFCVKNSGTNLISKMKGLKVSKKIVPDASAKTMERLGLVTPGKRSKTLKKIKNKLRSLGLVSTRAKSIELQIYLHAMKSVRPVESYKMILSKVLKQTTIVDMQKSAKSI